MDMQDTARLALVGYGIFLLLAFGLRSVVHWRRTGATGFVGLTGRPGSAEWWGGVLFAASVVGGGAGPALQGLGVVAPLYDSRLLHVLGAALYAAGVAGTLWSQFAMGESWRIGVNEAERTELVARGPFRWVRNPIFTAMTLATIGLALVVPNVIAIATVALLVIALEVQVRLVEEPYLGRAHGDRYARYAATVGRFLPGLGKSGKLETPAN